MDLSTILLLAAAGLAAGVVNTLAGGGSFLTLAALTLLAGVPVDVANGSNRVAVVVQGVATVTAFWRRGHAPHPILRRLVPATLTGAAVGAWLSLQLSRDVFEDVVAVAMIGMMLLVLLRPKRFLQGTQTPPRLPPGVLDLAFFCVGLYGGFLQAGVGVFLLAALVWLAGRNLVDANVLKAWLVLGFTVPALGVFVVEGAVDWAAGVAVAAGSAVGGALGARIAVAGGARVVRWVLLAVLAVSAVRMLA